MHSVEVGATRLALNAEYERVHIRKVKFVAGIGLAGVSNCTEYTLEIFACRRVAVLAKSSFFRLHGAIFGLRVPKWEENLRTGIGEGPVDA
jgi:hypothetical protein